jgi:dTDP-4-amino-4,6-dideoxygalactose transaminase
MDFSKTYMTEVMKRALVESFDSGFWQGGGPYTKKVESILQERFGCDVWMMTSCTHALELAIRLCGLSDGDEVILPSFAYPSAANAVLLSGASIRYAPVDALSYCLDVDALEGLVNEKTKAVIVVHYGGNSYKIRELAEFCRKKGLFLIEDAAQAIGSMVDGKQLGTFGDFGTISFHSTKNVGCGEGGALVVAERHRDKRHEIECFIDKGTDHKAYRRGDREFYQWSALGSSYVPSDLLMAILYEGLQTFDEDNKQRVAAHRRYAEFFNELEHPAIMNYSDRVRGECQHNAHLFYLVFQDKGGAQGFIEGMKARGIPCYLHFYPLHTSEFGRQFDKKDTDLFVEEHLWDCLVRLPLYTRMTQEEVERVLAAATNVLESIHG